MRYILDTDICSYIIKGTSSVLLQNLELHAQDDISITAITYAELLFGAEKKQSRKIQNKIEAIASIVGIIAFNQNAEREYAKIRTELEKAGTPIGNMDILIASCAIAEDAVLVTNNERHFSNIKKLQIENWTQ